MTTQTTTTTTTTTANAAAAAAAADKNYWESVAAYKLACRRGEWDEADVILDEIMTMLEDNDNTPFIKPREHEDFEDWA